jgi:hypothetical protein
VAKICVVQPCVFEKLGCAAGEKMLRNTGAEQHAGCRHTLLLVTEATIGSSDSAEVKWVCAL